MASESPTLAQLRDRTVHELETLATELAEIELLAQQARAEAGRHEARRASTNERVATLTKTAKSEPPEALELSGQLVTLTKRAALMEAQVDVLEGKAKVLVRYRDSVAQLAGALAALEELGVVVPALPPPVGEAPPPGQPDEAATMPPAVSRMVLGAQEDLRREIARAMHDGPAQSLTNIVLQAQIVERLVSRDPEQARGEIRQLVAMVQSTLDATKSFIFDVRPMVLDDLGLVPTLRRAARERGRRAQVPVEFESLGQDRRLPMEVEGGLFRIIDEALAAFLGSAPDRVRIRLDWGDQVEALVTAERDAPPSESEPWIPLAMSAWRELHARAATLAVTAEMLADGAQVRLVVEGPAAQEGG